MCYKVQLPKMIMGAILWAMTGTATVQAEEAAISHLTEISKQAIRGTVTDVASGEVMIGVTIQVEDLANVATITDIDGNFEIKGVPVGRHSICVRYVGYEPLVLKEQLLSAGKEMVLNISMRESLNQLSEIVVKPNVNKQMPLNEMAQVGARMLSVEEASRYAGGMADPARTASMFAGVAASGATNGISIHGNSPAMLQWRIEGIEVGNPNHFAEITEAGGGVFTSLNGTMLANSDFLTGAMPAEYGNALSGAFDMKMRAGNNQKFEHAFQLGTLGVDVASEGPLGKIGTTKASYLINYRYSFLEIAKKIHAINMEKETLDYQDLSFKLNFPTNNAGSFAVWFTGLYDRYENEVPDVSDWETLWDMNDSHSRAYSCAGGVNHSYRFKSGGRLISSIAVTGNHISLGQNDYDEQMVKMPHSDGENNQMNYIFDVQHRHKFSSRYTMMNGINHQHYDFNLRLDNVADLGGPMMRVYASKGSTALTRLYTSHKINMTDQLSAVAGVNVMWFNLNDQWLVEPRASLSYKATDASTFSLAYAMNSRKENTDVYFVTTPGSATSPSDQTNEELGLTRSHHVSFTYAQRLGNEAQFKVEPYYQYIFDVPVEEGTTWSVINNRYFFCDRHLVNKGAARNYGIDFTLERYLKDGLYGMFTATLFKSEYEDAQGEWHSTRHDRLYIANILGGKEWMVGKRKSNIFGINARFTVQGGDRYSAIPDGMTIDDIMARKDRSVPEDTVDPFSKSTDPVIGYAASVKYTLNKEHVAHHFILEYMKMSTFQGQTVDIRTRKIVDKYTSLTFPNIAYRVEF